MHHCHILHRYKKVVLILLSLILPFYLYAQQPAFRVVPLGVLGGLDESNLSAYMVAPYQSNNYVCLDAGTLHAGIAKAVTGHVFNIPAEDVLKRYIKGYLISHPHLDHLAGLVINSPADTAKNIYALQSCIDVLKTHYFTWQSWANFADQGQAPALGKYHYRVLIPQKLTPLANTAMQVQAFPLSHANLQSTAFLLKTDNNYLLYLGDTGADAVEKSDHLKKLWQSIAPLIKSHRLKAVMIEVSFPDEQPDKTLFGHLTPHWLMAELNVLAGYCGKSALKNLNVVIIHLKPPAKDIIAIKKQLAVQNHLGLHIIYPQQGKALVF